MDEKLKNLLDQESELQFSRFDEDIAWKIGSQLWERAKSEKLPITIDITRGAQQLFHASRRGTSADNDEWVKRKVRLVYRFGHSSYYMGQLLKSMGKTIEEAFLIPECDYAPHGGCFPIFIKGAGIVGAITVSGLVQDEDHRIVVEAIRSYLSQEE